jgi:hypothetical protein
MTLRYKRNLPLVLLLVGILSLFALTMGNQPIVSYTVNTQTLQTVQLTSVTDDLVQWTGLFNADTTNIGSQLNIIQP